MKECPTSNFWPYGLLRAPGYTGITDIEKDAGRVEETFLSRKVIYVFPVTENDPNASDMDRGCNAEAQGAGRLDRAINYFQYLHRTHRKSFATQLVISPAKSMNGGTGFFSECAIESVFDTLSGCMPLDPDHLAPVATPSQ